MCNPTPGFAQTVDSHTAGLLVEAAAMARARTIADAIDAAADGDTIECPSEATRQAARLYAAASCPAKALTLVRDTFGIKGEKDGDETQDAIDAEFAHRVNDE